MSFGEAINSGLSNYFTFWGRASRSEYWFWHLFVLLFAGVAIGLDHLLGTTFTIEQADTGAKVPDFYGWVYMVIMLFLTLPSLAVTVRRLHDTGRSGWWYWITLLPLLGGILLLIWLCTPGPDGPNAYGDDPLG
ncbi:MAG: DUF805 domain-containing protein [Proteobacteria bacterium]|nr:DUF805 domain-containing protein [Pseudomonadota bacterium]